MTADGTTLLGSAEANSNAAAIASMLAHLATNSLGYVIAWFVTR